MRHVPTLLLMAGALGCSPRPAPATPNATTTASPSVVASASAPADAGEATTPHQAPAAFAPTFDEEMSCRRRNCYTGGAKHCLDTCYRYNHPMHPERQAVCNTSCRRNYDIQACDDACARDRRAFARIPRAVPSACRTAMGACRRGCKGQPENSCELRCLVKLETCESPAAE